MKNVVGNTPTIYLILKSPIFYKNKNNNNGNFKQNSLGNNGIYEIFEVYSRVKKKRNLVRISNKKYGYAH